MRETVTVGLWLTGAVVLPHAAEFVAPAVISMPAARWPSIVGSLKDACVWARPVYHERPPS